MTASLEPRKRGLEGFVVPPKPPQSDMQKWGDLSNRWRGVSAWVQGADRRDLYSQQFGSKRSYGGARGEKGYWHPNPAGERGPTRLSPPIPSFFSPPIVGISPTPLTLRGGGGLSAEGAALEGSIPSSQERQREEEGWQGEWMEFPVARGPKAACCPPALPTSPPSKFPGCPIVGTRRGVVALSFPRAERAGPRQDRVPPGSFFALPPRVWQGETRLLLPRVKGPKLA